MNFIWLVCTFRTIPSVEQHASDLLSILSGRWQTHSLDCYPRIQYHLLRCTSKGRWGRIQSGPWLPRNCTTMHVNIYAAVINRPLSCQWLRSEVQVWRPICPKWRRMVISILRISLLHETDHMPKSNLDCRTLTSVSPFWKHFSIVYRRSSESSQSLRSELLYGSRSVRLSVHSHSHLAIYPRLTQDWLYLQYRVKERQDGLVDDGESHSSTFDSSADSFPTSRRGTHGVTKCVSQHSNARLVAHRGKVLHQGTAIFCQHQRDSDYTYWWTQPQWTNADGWYRD